MSIYDNADLHVGFRVHGHVSALKRRVYSYLLEQDGRGCDYGLTLSKNISVPNFTSVRPPVNLKSCFRLYFDRIMKKVLVPSVPAEEIVSLIREDYHQGFQKFAGLEKEIESFSNATIQSIKFVLKSTRQ